MRLKAGSPIQVGDEVAIGPTGEAHAVPRRHDWDSHAVGAVCRACGILWSDASHAFDPAGREPCPGDRDAGMTTTGHERLIAKIRQMRLIGLLRAAPHRRVDASINASDVEAVREAIIAAIEEEDTDPAVLGQDSDTCKKST